MTDINDAAQRLKPQGHLPDDPPQKQRIVATYDYTDETGNLLYQVCRMEPKSFRQRRPDGRGGWTWNVKGVRQVPYRVPEILSAGAGAGVCVVEGEKDADRLAGIGVFATTNAGGASKWRAEFADHLAGRCVAILPDNDEAGRTHARQVLASLRTKSIEAKIVTLPGLPEKGDVSDWLDNGGTVETLGKLYNEAQRVEAGAKEAASKGVGTSIDEAAEALSYINADLLYAEWVHVLMARHNEFGMDGLALADQWSSAGDKYVPGEVEDKFKGFTPGGGITIASVFQLAEAGGCDLSALRRKHQGGKAEAKDDDRLDLSQDALALELGSERFDDDARYVAPWNRWLLWDDTRWKPDERLHHLTLTRQFCRDRARELTAWAAEGGDEKLQRWAARQAQTLRDKTTVTAVESLCRSNPASVAGPEDFDSDLLTLGTPDGTVDLRTGKMRAARRSDMISKQTLCGPASGRPERWLKFLHEIFDGDQEIIAFMQRAAGYALTGLTTEHKLFFLFGSGRNGKSVFLNTLETIWSDYARRSAASTFLHTSGDKHPTGLAGLQGARLVTGSELPKGKTWDEAVIKDLTGGDRMSAHFMRGDFFDFDPQLTLMIAGNNQPSFRGIDEAIRARVVMIPFTVFIPPEKRDKNLLEKLRAEAPQILSWAIEGARIWLERGLEVPASVSAASTTYLDDEDLIGRFLSDEITLNADDFSTTADVHQRFVFWCRRQELHPWTQHQLTKELKSRGFQEHRRNFGRGFLGLRLNRLQPTMAEQYAAG